MERNSGRDAGFPADLSFALRLKPLASLAVAPTPDARSLWGSPGLALKASAEFKSSPVGVAAPQPGNQSGARPQGGNPDGSPDHRPVTLSTDLANPPMKAARTEQTESPGAVEGANLRAPGLESRVAPPIQFTPSAAALPAPIAAKAAQPASAPTAPPRELEDPLLTARPAREISLQISSDGERKVDVRLVQRAGEVLVSVRTPDATLAHEMRQDLGSLTGKLAQSSYAAEQFTPLSASASHLSDQRNAPGNQDPSRGNSQDRQPGGSGQQQQPQEEGGKRPDWVAELENSLAQRQTNRSTAWLLNR